ncbi:MAG TPA: amino acid ABC transporter substrate-binding protein [Desulfobacteraceae bacterium]|nr:amino acid ABC transporter substrate-binding protein [Desulfobacteraceae bacterium]
MEMIFFSPMRTYMLATAILVMMIACNNNSSPASQAKEKESVIEQVQKRGVLRVGMSTFVPWAMKDKTGNLIGFEIDVAKRLAKDTGVEVDFVPTKWSGIIPALITGKFDVIIGGMGIIPSRNLKVNFSIPYDYTGMSIVAHKTIAAGFSRLEDFNSSSVVIAARLGSTAVTAAKKYMPKATLRLFDDESQAYQELVNGKVHAVVGSAPTPEFQAIKYPNKLFIPLDKTFTREPIGFAVKKGDFDTLNYLDNWIRYVESEGWLTDRKNYWFRSKDWEKMIK